MSEADRSVLRVRRSILIAAPVERVWREFATQERLAAWWGLGHALDKFEPKQGGRIEMSIDRDGERASFGGEIKVFAHLRELTFADDWIPNRGWAAPTWITLRLISALKGTLVEFFHFGFEHVGGDVAAEHAAYEASWGMTQLDALKRLVETNT